MEIDVEAFENVMLKIRNAHVSIEKGTMASVTCADDNDMHVRINESSTTLIVESEGAKESGMPAMIAITLPKLGRLAVYENCECSCVGFEGNSLQIDGAGNVDIKTVSICYDRVNVTLSGNAMLTTDKCTVREISLSMSGKCDSDLSGIGGIDSLSVKIAGLGHVNSPVSPNVCDINGPGRILVTNQM